jgi:REP element-mobilizing transposase RayT
MSARQINALRGTPGTPFWQRDFYERIVRDEEALRRIREYIRRNPERWALRRRAA